MPKKYYRRWFCCVGHVPLEGPIYFIMDKCLGVPPLMQYFQPHGFHSFPHSHHRRPICYKLTVDMDLSRVPADTRHCLFLHGIAAALEPHESHAPPRPLAIYQTTVATNIW